MDETIFDELKRYVGFGPEDEAALRALYPVTMEHFTAVADVFYRRILEHEKARQALEGGESRVGHLKVTLAHWMDELLRGPWDQAYFERRCNIGRVHVRIKLPQHYMFGAMNILRLEFVRMVDAHKWPSDQDRIRVRAALAKILDLELAIMLHTYREDLLKAQAASERLATFGQLVGSIGHELRNPLGVIETSLYILKNRPLAHQDERAAKHLGRIAEQVDVANHIVTSLLDMIRDRPLARTRVQLAEAWAAAVADVQRPDGIRIEAHGLEGLPPVTGDATQLRQVFFNLLDNAVAALGEQGRIRLEARELDGALELVVEDTGPGVDASVRTRLFEPLMTTKVKGLGLGLPLVKRILERHGGSIRYAPREGVGARFVMRLPRAAAGEG